MRAHRLKRVLLDTAPLRLDRDFRWLWTGQAINGVGSQITRLALPYQVYVLTNSTLAIAALTLFQLLPILVFSLGAGSIADAVDRRRMLRITQLGLMACSLFLAILAFQPSVPLPLLFLVAFASAAFASLDQPARSSAIPRLVPRERLPAAIALGQLNFQIASVVGPTLAGLVIAGAGIGWVYAVNAVSFLMVIVALLLMRVRPRVGLPESVTITWAAAKEGLHFVFSQPIVRSTMLLDFIATFFASATALLPIFAQDILRVGARGYGWLYAAPSIGAVVAGFITAHTVDRIERRGAVLLWSVAAYGAATVVFGLSRSFALTLLCLAGVGAADTVSTVIRNIIRQLETPDELRGRMTGVNMMFFMGGPQLGELEAGVTAQFLGATFSVVSGGLGCLAATGAVAWREQRLRQYRR